ncbi:MAG TPA: serine hydrolase domain-containing protein [Roseomonas sp.]|nr:serine hydrolase domain-containing protein [Roseomonas sp.]
MNLVAQCDAVLRDAAAQGRVPGVVAMAAGPEGMLYQGAAGLRDVATGLPMQPDTVFRIASLTKAVTSVAALQLVERGALSLDTPLAGLLPEMADLQVLEGFGTDGTPRLRPPARPVTLRHLLTHTAGFGYDMWNPEILRYQEVTDHPSTRTARRAALLAPLLFDPGERWNYSIATDWAGLAVEAASGLGLEDYVQRHILGPLGMRDSGFLLPRERQARLAALHRRDEEGGWSNQPPAPASPPPEFHRGGGAMYATAPDYLTFLRMLLAGGEWGGARILSPASMALVSHNQIGDRPVTPMRSAMPALTCDVDLFPGTPLRWSLAFLVNEADVPGRRRAGSFGWAGLTNCYGWVDPSRQLAAILMMQFHPFADPAALAVLEDFERVLYAGT